MQDFKDFCSDVFATLGRTDQRRAAETYLYGLLNCPGRKSIRRLVATAPGRSEQSLQQFINQSPWDPEPIRQRLMTHLVREVRPTAWVIEEVHFPKHGHYSAAVERQYIRSLGRVCNSQLAITVTLTAGKHTVPVNWRLIVPDSWGRDRERRARARMPDHELPRPYWQYQIEVLDDMALEWGMPSAPVLVDTTHRGNVDAFLCALNLRRQPYVAEVSPNLGVCYEPPTTRGTMPEGGAVRLGGQPSSPRLLICEWPLGKPRPRGFWVTNMVDRPLSELVELAKMRQLAGPRIEEFAGRYGLRDYEGRTFAGWHHHVTLATAAYTYDVLADLRGNSESASAPSGRLTERAVVQQAAS